MGKGNTIEQHGSMHWRQEAGFSLIAVTWIVLLLSLLAAGVLALSLNIRQSTATLERITLDRLLVESAFDLFIHRYFYDDVEQVYNNGIVAVGAQDINIIVTYEEGKINLNRTPEQMLSAMFVTAGQNEETALALAAAIADWRDTNSDTRANGAEMVDYQDADKKGPRNGPFETLGELRQVLGMTEALYRCVAPMLTVTARRAPFPEIAYSPDRVRAVSAFAYENNWQTPTQLPFPWPNPAATTTQNSVTGAGSNSLSGRAMTLTLAIENDPERTYKMAIRFSANTRASVSYKRLSTLSLINSFEIAPVCP